MVKEILETNTNLSFKVGGHCQPCLAINCLLAQVHIPLWAGINDFNVYALMVAGSDVGCDYYECVDMCGIPDALRWRVAVSLQ